MIRCWAGTRLPAILLLAGVGLLGGTRAGAVPSCPTPITVTQPDGTKIKLRLRGDEFHHWHEDETGFTIVKEATTSRWVYAIPDGKGGLAPSSASAGAADPKKLGIPQHLVDTAATSRAKTLAIDRQSSSTSPQTLLRAPKTGTMKNLVLLVQFSDLAGTRTAQEFDALFNTVGYNVDGAQGSVKDYYHQVSYNALTVESVVADWVTLDHGYAYYGANDTSGNDVRPRQMVQEALAKLEARGFDFSSLDGDNDGWVDGLTIIHAGGGEEYSGNNPDYIWSHSWTMTSTVTYDGKSLLAYHTEPERRGWDTAPSTQGITRIGVICHETGHFLGLPDLYDYGYDSKGAGDFCLMAGGNWNGDYGTTPALMSAWCKKSLGWLTPSVLTGAGTYTLPRVEDNATVYQLNGAFPSTQYFLIENRQGYGFDSALPGTTRGLLIWHVDETQSNNNDQTHYLVDLEEASGVQHLELNQNEGDDSDYYREGNNVVFSSSSTPNNLSYSGSPLGLDVTSVSASGPTMTLTVTIPGGLAAPALNAEPAVTPGTSNTISWSPPAAATEAQAPQTGAETSSTTESPSPSGVMTLTDALTTTSQEVQPTTATLPGDLSLGGLGADASSSPERTLQSMFSEGFEGAFPGANWVLSGAPTWGKTTNDSHTGTYSAWCAGSTRSPTNGYVTSMAAWMIYGPFSLADATSAQLSFWYRNYSEANHGKFKWMASSDGTNYSGYYNHGDQNSWRSNSLSLNSFCGTNKVWVAFIFTSDASIAATNYVGAFVDDIVLQKNVPDGSDLTPYTPAAWNNKIPVGTSELAGSATHSYSGPFYDTETLYVNWASANQGSVAATNYTVHLEVTGTGGGTWDWSSQNTSPSAYSFLATDQALGPLAVGSHTLKLWVDYGATVTESDESNNYFERTITVASGLIEYYAECATNSGFTSPIASGWIQPTQCTFTNLTPGRTYWYRVKARRGGAETEWSNVESSQQEPLPAIAVTPASLDFGSIPIGATSNLVVGVTNTGGGTLDGGASAVAPFSVVSGNSYSLAANQGLFVTIRYAPTAAGTQTDVVTLTGGGGTTVALTGAAFVPTNQPPSFTKGPDVVCVQNATLQTIANWATNISPGPVWESSQTLIFIVTNDKNYLFSSPPAINASGTLTFTPTHNLRGTATVWVRLSDSGGTANGGQDTSALQTFLITVGSPTDANADGLPDDWQAAYGLTTQPASADSDGDGFSNYDEFLAGTDPTNAADCLRILVIEEALGGESLTIKTVLGKTYRVERNDDFPNGTWNQIGTDVTGTGGEVQVVDSAAAALGKAVYRVRLAP